MKRSLLLIAFITFQVIGFSSNAQNETESNFRFDNSERTVSWIKVFEIGQNIDISELKRYFSESRILNIQTENPNSFSAEFVKRPIDIQKYGYARGTTPMVLLDVEQIFNASVEYKEGRYRVILTNLGYIDDGVLSDIAQRALVGNTSTTAKGNIESYNGDFSFNKRNEVRKSYSRIFEILDKFYSDMMSYKKPASGNDDW